MKLVDKYYNKIHKHTSKMTKKLFGKNVTECMAMRFNLKTVIEKIINKPIDEITNEDIIKNKIHYYYVKYKTVSKILEVLETACTLKNFTIEEYENER